MPKLQDTLSTKTTKHPESGCLRDRLFLFVDAEGRKAREAMHQSWRQLPSLGMLSGRLSSKCDAATLTAPDFIVLRLCNSVPLALTWRLGFGGGWAGVLPPLPEVSSRYFVLDGCNV